MPKKSKNTGGVGQPNTDGILANGERIPTVFDVDVLDFIPKTRTERRRQEMLDNLSLVVASYEHHPIVKELEREAEDAVSAALTDAISSITGTLGDAITAVDGKSKKKKKKKKTSNKKSKKTRDGTHPNEEVVLFDPRMPHVDVRDVGTIVRSTGLNPTEDMILQIIKDLEGLLSTGFVSSKRLKELIMNIFVTQKYKGQLIVKDDEKKILKAFQTLDTENKGYLEVGALRNTLTTMGEGFNDEEIDAMVCAAVDADGQRIYYDDLAFELAR